jgi:MFS family permease
MVSKTQSAIRLGLRENWQQFALLVIVNAFVGGMVGLERTLLPLLAENEFGLVSKTAVLSFIITFGLVKAIANLFAGQISDRFGRKGALILGWLFGLPVPFIVMFAPSWGWIIFANILLGINQGLAWSTTVIMKIDLVGPKQRGLAMGLNEAAGYIFVSLAAFASSYIAAATSLRPEPFYLGVVFALLGLGLSIFFVHETQGHVQHESKLQQNEKKDNQENKLSFREIFVFTSWKNKALFSASQAGMINNLNDGLAWGLFPLFFAAGGLSLEQIGILTATYPAVWGIVQLGTGALSDRWGRKWMIVTGMCLQGTAILAIALSSSFISWLLAAIVLGFGTALVYPTLLATISDVAHPEWRASSVGVYRLWRDSGFAVGALIAGILADIFGMNWAIAAIGLLTIFSGVIVAIVMYETLEKNKQEEI